MGESQSSYRQIFKATSIFGGVRVITVIIALIREKIVALLIGPVGIGVFGLFSSGIGLIEGLTSFGLETSAVKNIASAHATGDDKYAGKVMGVYKRLVWITGILGVILTLAFSRGLSEMTFGNDEYTLGFILLSITLLFKQLSGAQGVVLQSLRKIKLLAKLNIVKAASSLLISLPIYFYFGIDGVVMVLILSSVIDLLLAWYYGGKVRIKVLKVNVFDVFREGKDMLIMGFMLSLSDIITTGSSYFMRIFINNKGGVDDVGLYTAGLLLSTKYVGLVFSAMSADYYPRLSGISEDNKKMREVVNHQAEVALLILAPILTIFVVFADWLIYLLYSADFMRANDMIQWMAMGMYFRAVSWAIAFLFLAKGYSKIFFWSEFSANVYTLLLNVFCYSFWGLEGLGISFLLGYILYLFQVYFLGKYRVDFAFNTSLSKVLFVQVLLGILCFLSVKFLAYPMQYIAGAALIMASSYFSLSELDKRIGINNLLRKFKR